MILKNKLSPAYISNINLVKKLNNLNRLMGKLRFE